MSVLSLLWAAPLSAVASLCLFVECAGAADDPLETLDDPALAVLAISGDGATLAGFWYDENFMPHPVLFRGSVRHLLAFSGEIRATSRDGSVAVGRDFERNGAFRFDTATGTTALPMLNGGSFARADAVSGDGRFAVGTAGDGSGGNTARAVVWDGVGAPATFAGLDGAEWSAARAISRDGRFVGGSYGDGGGSRGFRADRNSGDLLTLGSFGGNSTTVHGISADGDTLVGISEDPSGTSEAFRFRASTGAFDRLGHLPGAFSAGSIASAVSADGAVIVGQAQDRDGLSSGFRFEETLGMQSVEQWLRDGGASLTDGLTADARGVSDDGQVVTGVLRDGRAYIARRTTAPSPGPTPGGTPDATGTDDADIAAVGDLMQGLSLLPGPELGIALAQRRMFEADLPVLTRPGPDPAAASPSVPLTCGERAAAQGVGLGQLYFRAGGARLATAAAGVDGCDMAMALRLPLGQETALRVGLYLGEGRYRYERQTGSLAGAGRISGRTELQSAGLGLRLERTIFETESGGAAGLDAEVDLATSRTGTAVERAGALRADLGPANRQSGRIAIGVGLRQNLGGGLAIRLRPELALPFASGTTTRAEIAGLGTLAVSGGESGLQERVTLALDVERRFGSGSLAVSVAADALSPAFSLSWQQVF